MANERLRSAMAKAQADIEAITQATGVDPKTVQRWLTGRVPHPRHRWAIANLLREDEGYLWPGARPDLSPGAEATSEVVAAYGHRTDIPNTKWSDLMATARRQIDLLGYAFLFLPEQFVDLALSIEVASRRWWKSGRTRAPGTASYAAGMTGWSTTSSSSGDG
jgi:hypothetical protein